MLLEIVKLLQQVDVGDILTGVFTLSGITVIFGIGVVWGAHRGMVRNIAREQAEHKKDIEFLLGVKDNHAEHLLKLKTIIQGANEDNGLVYDVRLLKRRMNAVNNILMAVKVKFDIKERKEYDE